MICRSSLMSPSLRPLATAAIALASLLAGCGESQKHATASPPKVTVAHPIKRTIVEQDEYVGRFVPVHVVEVRARVAGHRDRIHFSGVKIGNQGDLLCTI